MTYETIFVRALEKMSTSTKDEITGMIDETFDSFIKNGLQKVPERLLEKSLKLIEIIYRKLYTNCGTLDSKMSTFCRSVIANRFGRDSEWHNMAKEIVKISYEEKAQVIKEQREKFIKKNENIPSFNTKKVLEVIFEIDSDNKYKKAIALILASGCRPSELFHFSTFEVFNDKYVIQNGITKSKSKTSLVKPIVGLTSEKFISEVQLLRSLFPNSRREHNNGISAIISKGIIDEIYKTLGPYNNVMLRELYSKISYEIFHGDRVIFDSEVSLLLWSNKVLGHADGHFSTTTHYSTVNIEPDIEKGALDIYEIFNRSDSQEKFWRLCLSNGYGYSRKKARDLFKDMSANN